MTNNMTAVSFSLVASMLFGTHTILNKYVIKSKISNPFTVSFLQGSIRLLILLAVLLVFQIQIQLPDQNSLGIIAIYAIAGIAGDILFLKGLRTVDVTVFAPLFSFRTVFTAVLSYALSIEQYHPTQYLLIFALVPLSFWLTFDEKHIFRGFFKIGILYLLGYYFSLAIISVGANRGVTDLDFWSFSLWATLATAAGNLLFFGKIKAGWKEVNMSSLKPVLVLIPVGLIAALSQMRALGDNATLTTAIVSLPTSMILTIIIGMFKPKLLEWHPWWVYTLRLTVAGIMFVIVMAVSLGG